VGVVVDTGVGVSLFRIFFVPVPTTDDDVLVVLPLLLLLLLATGEGR
jgi:hypothetical protein